MQTGCGSVASCSAPAVAPPPSPVRAKGLVNHASESQEGILSTLPYHEAGQRPAGSQSTASRRAARGQAAASRWPVAGRWAAAAGAQPPASQWPASRQPYYETTTRQLQDNYETTTRQLRDNWHFTRIMRLQPFEGENLTHAFQNTRGTYSL